LACLCRDRPAALHAVPLADPGIEHAQVVIDLRDRADRRAWIASRGFLLNADRRGQAPQIIDVGFLQLPQKLAGVARQRFDIRPLPLGVESIERQGTFARAAYPREDDEPVAGKVEVDAAEVMFPGAP